MVILSIDDVITISQKLLNISQRGESVWNASENCVLISVTVSILFIIKANKYF